MDFYPAGQGWTVSLDQGGTSTSSLPTGPSARSQLYAGDTSGTQPTVQTSVQALGNGTFVPLTDIPGLTQGAVANSSGLAAFLNNLYKYLIGVA
ncbi:MAG: hypothetical protein KGI71_02035, partial [Patescibacteria group bacterium]|nr:hypothetical protein [Patescibacteria group bacterium]